MGAMGIGSMSNRQREGRDIIIRLTAAVESIAKDLKELHVDIKDDRRETGGRLNAIENRLTRIEAQP